MYGWEFCKQVLVSISKYEERFVLSSVINSMIIVSRQGITIILNYAFDYVLTILIADFDICSIDYTALLSYTSVW